MWSRKLHRGAFGADRGFTLIELMIVVVIIGVLAAIAYPSYVDYVKKARRSDAMDALLTLQNLQEKYRANNTTFGTLAQIGGSADSIDGYYTVGVVDDSATATGYTLTVLTATGSQAEDADCVDPDWMTITVNAENPRGIKEPEDCWEN